ncbi:MAG: frc 8 [Frankiales bacterium]|jgi:benzylsuccinate CoA-transferase BbsE subunit|nr:frc 8 [Frankiales bacterium]MCW2586356.1 frc 8 [Frankiales bacterium]
MSLTTPYTGLRVVELAEDPAGEYTGKLLADLGADVVKVEPPEGAASRGVGPFAEGQTGPEASLAFRAYNSTKKSVVLSDSEQDREQLRQLVLDADVLLTTGRSGDATARGLDFAQLRELSPRLVVLAVTPFGQDGPWAHYRSSDLIGLAAGGPLLSCGYDDHEIPPIRPGGDQGYLTAASFAHTGLLLALLERSRTGRGQLVDVSMHDSLAVSGELANPFWFYPRVKVQRQTARHAQPSPTQPALFRSADDRFLYFALILADQKPWQALVDWMDSAGLAADLVDPAFSDLAHRQRNFSHVQELVEVFFLVHDAEFLYHEGQRRGLPIGITNAPEDLFGDEHLQARGFFTPVEQPDGSTALQPGSPYRFSTFTPPGPTAAPRLGQHTAQVLAGAGHAEVGT